MPSTTNALLFPLKLLLTSAGALSIASGFRFCVSFLTRFSISQAPTIWSSVRSWLQPPYLYFVINIIIILIVASSRLRYRQRNDDETEDFARADAEPSPVPLYESPSAMPEFNVKFKYQRKWTEAAADVEEVKNVVEAEYGGRDQANYVCDEEDKNVTRKHGERMIVASRNIDYSIKIPSLESPATNLLSPRFAHRKRVKSSLKGGWRSKSSRETTTWEQEHETMDETWNKIMAGRQNEMAAVSDSRRTNYYMRAGPAVRLRAEPSLDQEELNRRAEEFIKKFNQEKKLEREASLQQQYMHAGHDDNN